VPAAGRSVRSVPADVIQRHAETKLGLMPKSELACVFLLIRDAHASDH
jgi:hypothetical protein